MIIGFPSSGFLPNGIQLAAFEKTPGDHPFGLLKNILLPDKAQLHVTVVAFNKAGLSSKVHSNSIAIDLSPPEFTKIWDGDEVDSE